jgi:genome maintenance exonuclease 1
LKNFIRHEFPEVIRIDGGRHRLYKVPNGNLYPSVTTVLGHLPNPGLDAWKKRVGETEAKRISKEATDRGTRIHGLAEDFLLGQPLQIDMFDHDMWNSLKPVMNKIDNIHALEGKLYSDKLKVAGTVDCIAEFDGRLSIIDFKTSKRPKDINNITDYFVQATAYSVMFQELFDIAIPDLTIIIGVDDEQPQIFHQKRKGFIQRLIDLRQSFKKINLL